MNLAKTAQPKGVFLISFTQLWESFSFYGMRSLLVLYLIQELQYGDKNAFLLYALYIALVEVWAAIGGYAADRFLGYRGSVLIGGGFIMLGHLLLTFSDSMPLFFGGLGAIICGSTLFRTNLHALLGLLYEKEDSRRDRGFTYLYMGINLGGFAASVICGIMAYAYGWHVGFGVAALGMLLGIVVFSFKASVFKSVETKTNPPIVVPILMCALASLAIGVMLSQYQISQIVVFPLAIGSFVALLYILGRKMPVVSIGAVAGSLLLLIGYFSAEELMGSLLMVFSENHINRLFFGFEIPSSVVTAINPLVIILLGPFLAKIRVSMGLKLFFAFFCLGSAFLILFVAALMPGASILYLICGFATIAIGELFLAPTIFSFCAKVAPTSAAGMMMGVVTLAYSIGSLLSGKISQLTMLPSSLFLLVGVLAILLALVLLGVEKGRFGFRRAQ